MNKTIHNILNDIQPETSHLELLLQILCSGLDGIQYQKFWFFVGRGGNGKGLLSRLMRIMLGEKFCYSPNEIILNNIGSKGGASPDFMDLRYKRYIIFTEMGESIKLTSYRKLTGGDEFTARPLYGGNQHFKLTSTDVGETNNKLDFDGKAENSDRRRACQIDFNSNYTDDESKIGKTINGISYRKANLEYSTTEFIASARDVFLDILLQAYKSNWCNGFIVFKIPEKIRIETEKFMNDTNLFQQVFNELYIVQGKEEKGAKELWENIKRTDTYKQKTKNLNTAKQYKRDDFNKWLDENFETKHNPQGTKLVIGIVNKYPDDDIVKE